jgi:hypothetical protein
VQREHIAGVAPPVAQVGCEEPAKDFLLERPWSHRMLQWERRRPEGQLEFQTGTVFVRVPVNVMLVASPWGLPLGYPEHSAPRHARDFG